MEKAAEKSFHDVVKSLGMGPETVTWREGWELSEATYDPNNLPELEDSYIRETTSWLRMTPEIAEHLLKGLSQFRDRPALRRVFHHCRFMLFQSGGPYPRREAIALSWPDISESVHPYGPVFYAYPYLAAVPMAREMHRARGIPEQITLDSLDDLELILTKHRKRSGRYAFPEKRWPLGYFEGIMFRLGRLNHRYQQYGRDLHGFRRKSDRRVVILAEANARFRRDGQYDGTCRVFDDHAWTSVFQQDAQLIRGNPITATGRALREIIELPADEWEPVLQQMDYVITMHIPSVGRMDFDAVGASIRQAMDFQKKYFTEREFKAFICHSWLFDNQFSVLLPKDSNIRRFQEEVYMYPLYRSGDAGFYQHIFGRRFDKLDDIPTDTSLLKLFVDRLRAGEQWHSGGCLLFPEDFDWGGKVYRSGRALYAD
jgi:hypothetical protein